VVRSRGLIVVGVTVRFIHIVLDISVCLDVLSTAVW
jgi:hypothetical protein